MIKKRGDALGIMLLESGWGSMLPTVFIAHLANHSAAALSQRLVVGDHILTCNGASLVGLPLSECNTILKVEFIQSDCYTFNTTKVILLECFFQFF